MFQIGDKVVYPVHGAGEICGLEKKQILGEERLYYVLSICNQDADMKVLIPESKALDLGLRYLSDDITVRRVYSILHEDMGTMDDKWSKRYRAHMEKIKSGNILELALLVKNLSLKNLTSPLSIGEKKLLMQAMDILTSELALIENEKIDTLKERIEAIFTKE